jgi:uncharacterized protein (DUF302 family)
MFKNLILIGFLAFLANHVHADNLTADDGTQVMILSVDSEYDFDTTVERVKSAISNNNFRYLKESGYQDASRESRTLFFCNFDMLAQSIEQDGRVAVGLPCSIVVTRSDRAVIIQTINPELAAQSMGLEPTRLCQELHGMLIDVMDEAVL